MLPVHPVRRLAESFPLYERCFDAPELDGSGVGVRVDHERLAARLAAKAAAVELIVGVVPWPAVQGSPSVGSKLGPPSERVCSLMRAVDVRGPGVPRLDARALHSMLHASKIHVATDPLLVSLTHDAGLAAALVVSAA